MQESAQKYRYPYNDVKWNGLVVWITPLHPLREEKTVTWYQDSEGGGLLITEDEGRNPGVLEVYDTDLKRSLGILYWSNKPQGANTAGRAIWKPAPGVKLNAREKKITMNVLDLYRRRKELGIVVLGE